MAHISEEVDAFRGPDIEQDKDVALSHTGPPLDEQDAYRGPDIEQDVAPSHTGPPQPATAQSNIPSDTTLYPSYERGEGEERVAVIINNMKFKGSLVERTHSSVDADALYKLLNDMQFEKIKCDSDTENLVCEGIKKLLERMSEKECKKASCFVCIVLSYGGPGFIHGADGIKDTMGTHEILESFKGDKCKFLINKPKLCFIQTCPVKWQNAHDGAFNAECDVSTSGSHKIPVEADQLLVQSCIPGDMHYKESKSSLFVETLTKALRDSWKKGNVVDLLSTVTHMNGMIAEAIEKHPELKVPYTSSTLRKDVTF